MRVWLARGFLGVVVLVVAFTGWVQVSTYHPADQERVDITGADGAPIAPSDRPLKILSWNLQFLAGNRDNWFFYSGGEDPWPTRERTETVADEIAAVILRENPDILLLQEVDEGAARTHSLDQTAMLQARLQGRYPVTTETFYWKADFVPHPAIMGSAGMKLVILSKYRLEAAQRYALPAITSDDFLTRQFNLKRAILTADLPLVGGARLTLLNTHLSAFAQGDDTMSRQVARVMDVTRRLDGDDAPWVMGGDFNLLPDWQAYEDLPPAGRAAYNPAGTELAPLLATYPSVPALDDMAGTARADWYTHSPATDPERTLNKTIDYIFYAPGVMVSSAQVLQDGTLLISDHMPVVAEFSLDLNGDRP